MGLIQGITPTATPGRGVDGTAAIGPAVAVQPRARRDSESSCRPTSRPARASALSRSCGCGCCPRLRLSLGTNAALPRPSPARPRVETQGGTAPSLTGPDRRVASNLGGVKSPLHGQSIKSSTARAPQRATPLGILPFSKMPPRPERCRDPSRARSGRGRGFSARSPDLLHVSGDQPRRGLGTAHRGRAPREP